MYGAFDENTRSICNRLGMPPNKAPLLQIMAHPYLKQLQDLVGAVNRGDVELVCKHFFSGAALYADGKICASLTPAGLAFKLSRQRCKDLIDSHIAVPLCYFEGAPKKTNYALFPELDELNSTSISAYFNECIENSRD